MVFVYLREKELPGRFDRNSKVELCCFKGRAVCNLWWILAFVKFSLFLKASLLTHYVAGKFSLPV